MMDNEELEYANSVFRMVAEAEFSTDNEWQALDLLLDAAGFMAAKVNVPPHQALERLTAAFDVYKDAPDVRPS